MIYVTPFRATDKVTTGPSVDSGFITMNDIIKVMGKPLAQHKGMLIYGPGDDRVLFSQLRFQL